MRPGYFRLESHQQIFNVSDASTGKPQQSRRTTNFAKVSLYEPRGTSQEGQVREDLTTDGVRKYLRVLDLALSQSYDK